MKLLSGKQFSAWDAFTTEHTGISAAELMENAAKACYDWLAKNHLLKQPVKIFCGKGNNGGDGLALARLLLQDNIAVHTYILESNGEGSDEFQMQLHQLRNYTSEISFIQAETLFPPIEANDLVIDALFGTGLNRPVTGLAASLITHINQHSNCTVSLDLPSGMFTDESSLGNTIAIATHTLTFQAMKLCLLIAENAPFFGETHILDIGLHGDYLHQAEARFELITQKVLQPIYKQRNPFSHKGNYGHALIIAGSEHKMGAALLASKSCMRAGAGALTCCIPESGFSQMNSYLPDAMTINTDIKSPAQFDSYASIGIGPGLGFDAAAKKIINMVLSVYTGTVIMDADAINNVAALKDPLHYLPEGVILTPHPKEFERLFGKTANSFERIELALRLTAELPILIILKDHHSLIAWKGKGYFNTTGNAGMAKAGNGDVLTGILTALAAQGYSTLETALLGCYLHGLAGDLCLHKQSQESLLASDIIDCLGAAFKQFGSLI